MRRRITLQLQPEGSEQCGQTCVAMITGKPLAEICQRHNSFKATSAKTLCAILRAEGVTFCEPRRGAAWRDYQTAILTVKVQQGEKTLWHWVVYHAEQILCPTHGVNPDYLEAEGTMITNFIPVLKW